MKWNKCAQKKDTQKQIPTYTATHTHAYAHANEHTSALIALYVKAEKVKRICQRKRFAEYKENTS